MIGENLQTVRQNTEIFIKASKDIGLEVIPKRLNITSRHQNIVQNENKVIGNLSCENVEKFRYLGVTVANTNDIHEEIKRAYYYLHEKILSTSLLSRKLKVNT